MAEAHPSPKPQPLTNGHSHHDNDNEGDDDDDDVSMSHVSDQVAASATTTTSTLVDSAPNGTIRRSADRTIEEDGSEPPAKRARKYSNADQASLNHVSLVARTPTPGVLNVEVVHRLPPPSISRAHGGKSFHRRCRSQSGSGSHISPFCGSHSTGSGSSSSSSSSAISLTSRTRRQLYPSHRGAVEVL
jgi:hypothetical protein